MFTNKKGIFFFSPQQKAFFPFLFFFFLLLINLPFLLTYSQSFVSTLAKFTCDEYAFLQNIQIIFTQLFEGHLLGAGYNFYSFGYGSIYWFISTLFALPFWLLKSEQGIIISLRSLSLSFSLLSYFFIFLILKKHTQKILLAYFSILICFFNPLIIDYSNMIHPEMMYVFFLVLAIYFIDLDDNLFGKYYFYAVISFVFALSTKLIAFLFCPAFILYLFYNKKKISVHLCVKTLFAGSLTILLANFFLIFPLIFHRFLCWALSASQIVKSGFSGQPQKSISVNFALFSKNYFNIYLLLILSITCFIFLVIAHKKHIYVPIIFYISLILIPIYFIFSTIYCYIPSHYGISILYILPFLISISLKVVNNKQFILILMFLITALNSSNIINSIYKLINIQGSSHSREIFNTINHIQKFMLSYPKKISLVGASGNVGISPASKESSITVKWLDNATQKKELEVYDLIIIKKKDTYYNELTEKIESLQHFFTKIFSDNIIDVYENCNIGRRQVPRTPPCPPTP